MKALEAVKPHASKYFVAVSYKELAERLKKHGLQETEASIANKLSRRTFAATFFLASLAAIECEAVNIAEL